MNPDNIFSMEELRSWTMQNYLPEEVYPTPELEDWAKREGWVKK
jgi:hypothetical protein